MEKMLKVFVAKFEVLIQTFA